MILELEGNSYKTGRLNARQQFNVLRRLAPLITSGAQLLELAKTAQGIQAIPSAIEQAPANDAETGGSNPQFEEVATAFAPFASALSSLPDETLDYIFDTCIGCGQRKVNEQWRPLRNGSGPLLFQDIGLMAMLRITWETIVENMGDFFAVNPGKSQAQ